MTLVVTYISILYLISNVLNYPEKNDEEGLRGRQSLQKQQKTEEENSFDFMLLVRL